MGATQALLARARRSAGLSQAELARRADIPRSVLNAYEHGARQPGADALAKILAAAGFELTLKPTIDLERNARILSQVIEFAESLPHGPGRLAFPPFLERVDGPGSGGVSSV